MVELYILFLGTILGSIIALAGVLLGVRTYKDAIRPYTEPTPINDEKSQDTVDSSISGLDWSEYDEYIAQLQERDNES